MKFWICYEINESDSAGTTDFTDSWRKEFEILDTIDEAIIARWKLLEDKELYRNISPILSPIIMKRTL